MSTNTGERVFTSWKEIASFFGKGVRTVQRWERKFGLPISRPTAARNVVLASESELREWIRRASSQLTAGDATEILETSTHSNANDPMLPLAARLKRLEEDTARLAALVGTFSTRLDELTKSLSHPGPDSRQISSAALLKPPTEEPANVSRK